MNEGVSGDAGGAPMQEGGYFVTVDFMTRETVAEFLVFQDKQTARLAFPADG